MLRNVAGQAIGSQLLNVATGAAFDLPVPVTVYVTGDGGVQAVGVNAGGVCVNEGHGYFSYTPSQAETNYHLVAFTFVAPGAVPATVQVATITEAQQAAIATATITTVIGDGPTRAELLNQLAHRLNKTPPPNMDSATEARLGSYLNQRQRRLLTLPGLKRLRDATVSFTSTPNQANCGMPNVAKLSRLVDATNERVLYEMSQQDYRLLSPAPTTGVPEAYVWTGRQAVMQQPQAQALFVQSSALGDKALVYIEGVMVGGWPRVTTVTLQGTTPVNVALAVLWERIDKCYLSAPCLGTVTLSADSGTGPTLSCIPAGQVTSVYVGLTLFPTPTDVVTYVADITRPVTDLVRGTDQAALPEDFSDVLVLGALADEYQHLADERYALAVSEYRERENQLKYWLAETAIGRPFNLMPAQQGSQLGAWFPAGS